MSTNARKKYEATAVGNIATLAPAAQQSSTISKATFEKYSAWKRKGWWKLQTSSGKACQAIG